MCACVSAACVAGGCFVYHNLKWATITVHISLLNLHNAIKDVQLNQLLL
jgi:hypothetical protein